jgi:hypothetical protein
MARRPGLAVAALVPALLVPAASSSAATVTSLADSGPGTLRAAIADAAAGETIDFQAGLEGTVELTDVLEIAKDLRIDGPGARRLSLSGMDATRVLHVHGDGTVVEIDDLTIRDGLADTGAALGGGLLVTGGDLVRLERVALLDNEAHPTPSIPLGGGAAVVLGGRLELVDSTVAGNRAPGGGGGGIFAGGPATFEIVNSTIEGNTADGGAGLLALDAEGAVRGSTIAGNTATTIGGGIGASPAAVVTLERSLVSENAAATGAACDGPLLSGGGNVVDASCFAAPAAGDAVGAAPVAPLADHGGSTDTVMPQLGNPALDHFAGPCPAADQRGVVRPQGGACDAGAVEARVARLVAGGPLALGTVLVGDRSAAVSTTLTNTGEVDAVITGLAVTGPNAAEFEPAGACAAGHVLAPAAGCSLAATLAPATAGTKEAAFSVDLADPAQDVQVPITGTGQALPPAGQGTPTVPVTPPQAQVASATVALLGVSTRARTGGRFTLRLRCEAVAAPQCAGAVTLKLGARRVSRPFSILAGRDAVVKLRLSAADRRRLARKRSLKSAVTVITTQPDGTRRTTHQGAFKLLKARR